jgi:hypothetical protein
MRVLSQLAGVRESTPAGAAKTLDYKDAGATVLLDTAAGSVVTLPKSRGDQSRYRFVVSVLATSNSHVIKVGNTTDILQGGLGFFGSTGTAAFAFATNATSDTITLNRTTTGSANLGEWLEVYDVAAGTFAVSGMLSCTGSAAATPFSATV